MDLNLNLKQVPFSRHGSFIVFQSFPATETDPEYLGMRNVRGLAPRHEVMRIELLDGGTPVPFTEAATPTLLRLEGPSGHAEICIPEQKLARIKVVRAGLRLTISRHKYRYAMEVAHNRWLINAFPHQRFHIGACQLDRRPRSDIRRREAAGL